MDELAAHAVNIEEEMLSPTFESSCELLPIFAVGPDKAHKFYQSRREIEEFSTKYVLELTLKHLFVDLEAWFDECCDKSMKFSGSDREQDYIGFEDYSKHKRQTKVLGKPELLMTVLEGPLAVVVQKVNMQIEGEKSPKERVVALMMVVRDRKIRRIDSFYE